MAYPTERRKRITSECRVDSPFTSTSPLLGSCRRLMSLSVVVFPEPLRPSRTRVSPLAIAKLRSWRSSLPFSRRKETLRNSMTGRLSVMVWLDVRSSVFRCDDQVPVVCFCHGDHAFEFGDIVAGNSQDIPTNSLDFALVTFLAVSQQQCRNLRDVFRREKFLDFCEQVRIEWRRLGHVVTARRGIAASLQKDLTTA